ncbi:MAG: hypothetical protein AAF720_14270 [Pseudomonadota bacterium]
MGAAKFKLDRLNAYPVLSQHVSEKITQDIWGRQNSGVQDVDAEIQGLLQPINWVCHILERDQREPVGGENLESAKILLRKIYQNALSDDVKYAVLLARSALATSNPSQAIHCLRALCH